jgi:NADPH:quinone reductase-like Zn-dependent oxidoreductase
MTREVWRAVAERRLAPPPVHARFPLTEAAAAHQAAAGRDVFGRVVLQIDPPGDPASTAPATAVGQTA